MTCASWADRQSSTKWSIEQIPIVYLWKVRANYARVMFKLNTFWRRPHKGRSINIMMHHLSHTRLLFMNPASWKHVTRRWSPLNYTTQKHSATLGSIRWMTSTVSVACEGQTRSHASARAHTHTHTHTHIHYLAYVNFFKVVQQQKRISIGTINLLTKSYTIFFKKDTQFTSPSINFDTNHIN